jgi:hypothetical protein
MDRRWLVVVWLVRGLVAIPACTRESTGMSAPFARVETAERSSTGESDDRPATASGIVATELR